MVCGPERQPLVRAWRMYRKLSLTALANRADISKSYASEIEHFKKNPTDACLLALAAALEMRPEDLYRPPPVEPYRVSQEHVDALKAQWTELRLQFIRTHAAVAALIATHKRRGRQTSPTA